MSEHQNNEAADVEGTVSNSASKQLFSMQSANRESFFREIASHTGSKDIPTDKWTAPIAPAAMDGIKDTDCMEQMLDECRCQLDASDELDTEYQSIIVDQNYEALKEKSTRKASDLLKSYRGQSYKWNPVAQRRLSRKLTLFRNWTEEQLVVRSDEHGGEFDNFECPRLSGKVSSFGVQDIAIQSDRYVYASLSDMPHYMARNEATQFQIDIDTQHSEPELVMIDIADMRARHPKSWLAAYLCNLFDLENGKEILATYLATVFKDIEEAKLFLNANNHPNNVQHWDESVAIADIYDQKTGNVVVSKERCMEIQHAMKDILSAHGIEPPLSLEVRIPGKAAIAS